MPTYFVTGATGFIGRHLVERLLEREGDIHVLVRGGSTEKFEQLMERWGRPERIKPVFGDLSEPQLGIDEAARAQLQRVDHFFHLAAVYDITADDATNALLNVGGTQSAIDLANALGAKRFHHMSSIAVAGSYDGWFTEDDFDEGQEFPSPYHRTKFESEKLVRERAQVPWRAYRPSLVVGNSKTGAMDKIDGPYYFFKAIQKLRHALPQWFPLVSLEFGRTNLVRSSAFWIASSGMPRSARKLRLIPCSAGIFMAYESTPFGSMSVSFLSTRITACGACAALANAFMTSPDFGGFGSTMWNAWPSSPS